jgi:hypothetical protein
LIADDTALVVLSRREARVWDAVATWTGDAAVTAFTSASGEEETRRRQRWRLALGAEATPQLGALSGEAAQQEAVLAFLEGGGQDPGPGSREGTGLMTVPDWINRVHTLFPRSVADRIVDDAVNRYGMTDVATDPDALARATPNVSLLKAILSTKHLMNPEVLAMARSIIDTVVRDLMRTLARPVTNPFTGPPRSAASLPASGRGELRRPGHGAREPQACGSPDAAVGDPRAAVQHPGAAVAAALAGGGVGGSVRVDGRVGDSRGDHGGDLLGDLLDAHPSGRVRHRGSST